MLRVGLTGSIAVGKSFVSTTLAELGCRVLDADRIARQVVEPGQTGLKAVVEAFGTGVLNDRGELDRAALGAIVFADKDRRDFLNSILHPLIIGKQEDVMARWVQEGFDGVMVVDAALMIESGSFRRFDKLIVVHCRPEVQLERLMTRDKLSPIEAEKRIAAQMPQREKMAYADFLIDTTGGFEETRRETLEVYGALQLENAKRRAEHKQP